MMKPKNLSGRSAGYNDKMFRSDRGVRKAFMMLGYGINRCKHKVPQPTCRQFQLDYNKCATRFDQWGAVDVNGKLDTHCLNALEHALRWSKKRENTDGIPSAKSWQSLCSDKLTDSKSKCDAKSRAYSEVDKKAPEAAESSFIEIAQNGFAKLRNIHNDHALRADVINFERHGDVVFVTATIPPQADLPGGRLNQITCPCVFTQ